MPSPSSHLLLISFPAWGHARPLCVLATRLVTESEDVLVTILTVPEIFEKSRFEIARQFENSDSLTSKTHQRIRLISILDSAASNSSPMASMKKFAQAYPVAYEALSQGRPITCMARGTLFEAAPAPSAVVMDFFCLPQLQATRSLTGNAIPIISWITGGSPTLLRFFGPESMGGYGDLSAKIATEAERTSRTLLEVSDEIYKHTDGTVIRIPGVPAMYDYEFSPQKLPFEMPLAMVINGGREFLKDSDAMLVASSDAYERISLDAIRAWQSDNGKTVYAIGPLLPDIESTRFDIRDDNANVAPFLDEMLQQYGKQSVVFISFGTVFWPTKPEYIDEVVDALLEKRFPFILSHASPFAQVAPQLAEKVEASGLGLLTTWSPQQAILSHPATGWFLTHGGHGGITESLGSGVPLICWPFDADQPAAAAHLTENLKVAFELIEVRTGLGLKPLHRSGMAAKGTREAVGSEIRRVLDVCRAEEGVELRRNAQRLKEEFRAAWEMNGPARIALYEFLKTYTS